MLCSSGWADGRSCRLCSVSTWSFLHLHFRFWPGMAANRQCLSGGWVYLDPQNTIKHIWILCLKVRAMFTSCVLSTFSFIVSRDLTAFQIQDQFDYIVLFLIRHKNSLFLCSCVICRAQTGVESLKESERSPKAHHRAGTRSWLRLQQCQGWRHSPRGSPERNSGDADPVECALSRRSSCGALSLSSS